MGLVIDQQFILDAQCSALLAKSRTRRSIFANIAHRLWGMETAILRITHAALVNSLLRYGVNITGSCSPDDLINNLGAHGINPAARRIDGLNVNIS